jgi:hypothetical protein
MIWEWALERNFSRQCGLVDIGGWRAPKVLPICVTIAFTM